MSASEDNALGLATADYRGLRVIVAPAGEVSVWWPHPAEMDGVTDVYKDATATRFLHAVYTAEAGS